jgi:hypothetical protein
MRWNVCAATQTLTTKAGNKSLNHGRNFQIDLMEIAMKWWKLWENIWNYVNET